MNNRLKFVDIARCFAILFIVLGHTIVHSANCSIVCKFFYSFHVVLFFILSGYTFKIKNDKSFNKFLKNKFLRIMLPYFIWAILFLIPYMVLGQNVGASIGTNSSFDLKTQLINVLYGNGNMSNLKQNSSLWFLPALFSMEILYYFVIKFFVKTKKSEISILLISIIISYITNGLLRIYLPWGINTALNIGIFFYIGYLCNKYELFNKNKLFKWPVILLMLVVGIISFYFNSCVDWIDYSYGILTLALLSGFCLSIIVIYISFNIKENVILEYIGKNTMGILIFHKLIILIFQTKLGKISLLLKNSNFIIEFGLGLIIVFISIIFSLIINEIVKKLCPLIIGENKLKKVD